MSGQNEVAAQQFLLSSWITRTAVINLFNIIDFQFTSAYSGLVLSSPPPPSHKKEIWVDRVNTMCFQLIVIHYINFNSYKDFLKQLKRLA